MTTYGDSRRLGYRFRAWILRRFWPAPLIELDIFRNGLVHRRMARWLVYVQLKKNGYLVYSSNPFRVRQIGSGVQIDPVIPRPRVHNF